MQAPFWLCSEQEWQTDLDQINFEVFYWSWITSSDLIQNSALRACVVPQSDLQKWSTLCRDKERRAEGKYPRLPAKSLSHETTPLLYSQSENVEVCVLHQLP